MGGGIGWVCYVGFVWLVWVFGGLIGFWVLVVDLCYGLDLICWCLVLVVVLYCWFCWWVVTLFWVFGCLVVVWGC